MNDEIMNKLFESEVFSDDTKSAVKEAFEQALTEAKAEQEKAIRAELAERYERDKKAMHLALEQYMEQTLNEHVDSFHGSVKELNTLKVKYANAIQESKKLAKKHVEARIKQLEEAMDERINAHLTELHEDEKVNRRAYLKAINEAKAEYEAKTNNFKKTAAKVLENIIDVKVQSHLDVLAEDIKKAREADFGRELFESFAMVFRRQFFDSNKEFRKVVEELKESRETLQKVKATANKKLKEANIMLEETKAAKEALHENFQRQKTMSKLLSTLDGEARNQMKTLLEASKTKDLEKNFKKFLPEMAAKKTKTKVLSEKVLEIKTGGAKQLVETPQVDDDIVEISRLAGVSNRK